MKASEILANAPQFPVAKARNLGTVGWWAGYFTVKFKGRPTWYIFGPNVPEAELLKIVKNPFPDRIFTTNIKNKYQCHKVS